jgi:putative phosphoesterase
MSIAVISDIHGNFPALQAVLSHIEKEKADTIYCLGDLVGYYCMIDEVIETIRSLNIKTLLGNHDYALLYNEGVIPRSKTCTNILTRQLKEIKKENLDFLKTVEKSFEFNYSDKNFFCVHGGLEDNIDEYIHVIDESYFEKNNFIHDVLLSGHTHIQRNEVIGTKRYLNPGSVGQPRDGNPAASYLLLSGNSYEHKRVTYNIDLIAAEMKARNYEPYIYEILYRGIKVGG